MGMLKKAAALACLTGCTDPVPLGSDRAPEAQPARIVSVTMADQARFPFCAAAALDENVPDHGALKRSPSIVTDGQWTVASEGNSVKVETPSMASGHAEAADIARAIVRETLSCMTVTRAPV